MRSVATFKRPIWDCIGLSIQGIRKQLRANSLKRNGRENSTVYFNLIKAKHWTFVNPKEVSKALKTHSHSGVSLNLATQIGACEYQTS